MIALDIYIRELLDIAWIASGRRISGVSVFLTDSPVSSPCCAFHDAIRRAIVAVYFYVERIERSQIG